MQTVFRCPSPCPKYQCCKLNLFCSPLPCSLEVLTCCYEPDMSFFGVQSLIDAMSIVALSSSTHIGPNLNQACFCYHCQITINIKIAIIVIYVFNTIEFKMLLLPPHDSRADLKCDCQRIFIVI